MFDPIRKNSNSWRVKSLETFKHQVQRAELRYCTRGQASSGQERDLECCLVILIALCRSFIYVVTYTQVDPLGRPDRAECGRAAGGERSAAAGEREAVHFIAHGAEARSYHAQTRGSRGKLRPFIFVRGSALPARVSAGGVHGSLQVIDLSFFFPFCRVRVASSPVAVLPRFLRGLSLTAPRRPRETPEKTTTTTTKNVTKQPKTADRSRAAGRCCGTGPSSVAGADDYAGGAARATQEPHGVEQAAPSDRHQTDHVPGRHFDHQRLPLLCQVRTDSIPITSTSQ